MTHFKIAIAALATVFAGVASASAYAGQPAAGNLPLVGDVAAASSALTRAEVSAQIRGQLPAAGENNAVAGAVDHAASALSRSEVRHEAVQAAHDVSGFPAASGNVAF